jgi:hypothetical protein
VARAITLEPLGARTRTKIPGERFWFPIAPAEWEVGEEESWIHRTLVGGQHVAPPGSRNRARLAFESILPAAYGSWCGGLPNREFFLPSHRAVRVLAQLASRADQVRLSVFESPRGPAIWRAIVRVSSFVRRDRVGLVTDIPFRVEFEQVGAPGRFDLLAILVAGPHRTGTARRRGHVPAQVALRPGEDVPHLAHRVLGDMTAWRQIAKANGVDRHGYRRGVRVRVLTIPDGLRVDPGED